MSGVSLSVEAARGYGVGMRFLLLALCADLSACTTNGSSTQEDAGLDCTEAGVGLAYSVSDGCDAAAVCVEVNFGAAKCGAPNPVVCTCAGTTETVVGYCEYPPGYFRVGILHEGPCVPTPCPLAVPADKSPCDSSGGVAECKYDCAAGNGSAYVVRCVNSAWVVEGLGTACPPCTTNVPETCDTDAAVGDAADAGDADAD